MYEVREVLRLWVGGQSYRSIARLAQVDRKTVRRYIDAATAGGLVRSGGEEQVVSDELIQTVCEQVRPHRPGGHGAAWAVLVANHDQLRAWLDDEGLTVVKAHDLLARRGVVVPERTLHRYALEVLGIGRSSRATTVPVADGEPGKELQVDFGRMGLVPDPEAGRRRVCWALIFTACYSRHCFVWLTFRQTTKDVIAGFEAAWAYFGGIFSVVIPDNMGTIVDDPDSLAPRFNQAFREYAQARGFLIDPARVRKPTDKPRVERMVPFVRNSFFKGEVFVDLPDAQRRAEEWCQGRAGRRIHHTTACRPAEVVAMEEAPRLSPAPVSPYDLPIYSTAKVHRDHHIEVGRSLYSVPGNLIGARVEVRADSTLVRISHRGQVVKVHPRTRPGGRVTDAADLPSEKTAYALRDLGHLARLAAAEGPAIGAYATAVLDHPLPWTKMRQVYALLGRVRRFGPEAVEDACARALEAGAVNVPLIARMIERGGAPEPAPAPHRAAVPARFARHPDHFATTRPEGHKGSSPSDNAPGGVA